MQNINPGSIVKIKETRGYYRVTSIRGGKANLGAIFGKRLIYHKGVDVNTLLECEAEWYKAWSQTETYQCM